MARVGEWRLELADLSANPIATITSIARKRAFAFRLNSLGGNRASCEVPSDDPRIRNIHTDGYRILEPGLRLLQGRRYEYVPALGRNAYRLRYRGLVWQVQDTGTENDAGTAIVAVDLGIRLGKRFTGKRREFTSTSGTTIGKTLLDEANAVAPTGIVSGTVEASPTRTVVYQWRQLAEAIGELATAFDGYDLDLELLDPAPSASSLVRLNFLARKGTVRPDAVFVWGGPGHNVSRVERLVNMEKLANVITLIGAANTGGDAIVSAVSSASSIGTFGRYEVVEAITEISAQSYLDALSSDLLNLASQRRELLSFVPAPGRAPTPFEDFDLGDTVPVYAGDRLRGGIAGYQRIHGFDLALDEEGRELVNGVYTKDE